MIITRSTVRPVTTHLTVHQVITNVIHIFLLKYSRFDRESPKINYNINLYITNRYTNPYKNAHCAILLRLPCQRCRLSHRLAGVLAPVRPLLRRVRAVDLEMEVGSLRERSSPTPLWICRGICIIIIVCGFQLFVKMGQIWVLIGRGWSPTTPRHFWIICLRTSRFSRITT